MATTSAKIDEHPISLHADKIVYRLDLFPELVRALHDGDLQTGRWFCAQLFDCDTRRNRLGDVNTHHASRDESSLKIFPPFV